MKKLPCNYEHCGERRKHWCEPDKTRGIQLVEVPDDYNGPAYCSLTCALLGGAINLLQNPKKSSSLKD